MKEHSLLTYLQSRQKQNNKILIFDIETAPMKAYIWKLWKQNTHIDAVIDDWFVICWSAKWLNSDTVLGDCLTPSEAIAQDDKRIVTSLWKLFDQADIIVAHNGNKFDVPKMNSRFVINDLPPTTPYRTVDTCLIARKQFGFSSNKLDALATYFGFNHKLDTDFSLWQGCLEGDQKSLDYMLKYNKQDVVLLEQVYLKLRPWIKGHPNLNTMSKNPNLVCSNCGDANIQFIPRKYYYTQCRKYSLYKCNNCGTIFKHKIVK